MRAMNLSRTKFGKLTALWRIGSDKNGSALWLCKCECGSWVEVAARNLRSGATKSCGCSTKRVSGNRSVKFNTFIEDKENKDITYMYDAKGNKAIIDSEDVDTIKLFYWHGGSGGYWQHTSRKNGNILLHRYVMNAPEGKLVDHKFHNNSDNRKSELRICTDQQNQINRKPKKRIVDLPVGIYPVGRKYRAALRLKEIQLIRAFPTLEEAIEQRKQWEREYLGEYRYVK